MCNIHNIMSKIHNLDTKTRIVVLLLDESDREFTIREISQRVKIDYKTIYQNVDVLAKRGTICKRPVANAVFCSISRELNRDILSAESCRQESGLHNADIRQIFLQLRVMRNPFFICLLFGSYAKNKQTPKSDIDLMFVCENPESFEKKLREQLSPIPLKLHILVFSYNDFIRMLKEKDSVVSQAVKNYVILHGIEQFYGLLAHG